jgi:hypothetical protein
MNGVARRGALALLALAALGFMLQARLVNGLMEPWSAVIEWLEPDFHVVDLRARSAGAEHVVEVTVGPARVIVVGSRAIAPDASARAMAATPRGAVWVMLSLYLATLLAWPLQHAARECVLRALVGAPVLAALLLLDIPVSLLGPLRAVIVDSLSPGSSDLWVTASHFLRGGGRFLVAAGTAAAVCLAVQAALTRARAL